MKTPNVVLVVWLALFFIVHLVGLFFALFMSEELTKYSPAGEPEWMDHASILHSGLSLFFLAALFRWKKWGFWGYVLTSVGMSLAHLASGYGLVTSLQGLLSAAIIFGALQVGKEDKGWPQLE